MDHRSDIATLAAPAGQARVDQAVFTSTRSPMGEGYRLTASSPGISVQEKREITRRSPSHDSLDDVAPGASGLASYPLSSGRRCVAVSRHAGAEQSGRGGRRVYTHMIVMDRADFRRFGCDPLQVQRALEQALGGELVLRPNTRLDRLALSVGESGPLASSSAGSMAGVGGDANRIADLMSAVLSEQPLVVVGAPAPRRILRWTLGGLPCVTRESLATSYGLKLSPGRLFHLTFIESGGIETQRLVRGRDVALYDWESPPARDRSAFDAWIDFVRARWDAGRHADVERICARLTRTASAQNLQRIASVCMDIERVRGANEETLGELGKEYADVAPHGEVHAELVSLFHQAAAARREQLHEREPPDAAKSEPAPEAAEE